MNVIVDEIVSGANAQEHRPSGATGFRPHCVVIHPFSRGRPWFCLYGTRVFSMLTWLQK